MDLFTGGIEAAKLGEVVEIDNISYLKLDGGAFKKHEKTGKYFLNFMYEEMSEQAKEKAFGSTHYICLTQSKDDRENKVRKTYIGNGKHWGDNNNNNSGGSNNYQKQQGVKSGETTDDYSNSPVQEADLPF